MESYSQDRKKKSDKAKLTRQKNGPYSTRSARIKDEIISKSLIPQENSKKKT